MTGPMGFDATWDWWLIREAIAIAKGVADEVIEAGIDVDAFLPDSPERRAMMSAAELRRAVEMARLRMEARARLERAARAGAETIKRI